MGAAVNLVLSLAVGPIVFGKPVVDEVGDAEVKFAGDMVGTGVVELVGDSIGELVEVIFVGDALGEAVGDSVTHKPHALVQWKAIYVGFKSHSLGFALAHSSQLGSRL